jgi:hypothetical protein
MLLQPLRFIQFIVTRLLQVQSPMDGFEYMTPIREKSRKLGKDTMDLFTAFLTLLMVNYTRQDQKTAQCACGKRPLKIMVCGGITVDLIV